MAQREGTAGSERRKSTRRAKAGSSGRERRVATPRADLLVVKIGDRRRQADVPARERASGVLDRVARAIARPGVDRARIFQGSAGKRVYAYSIATEDPSKVVREDASGRKTLGRFVDGRFRAVRLSRANS